MAHTTMLEISCTGSFYITVKSVSFLNEGIFTLTSSVQDLPVILSLINFHSFEKALNCFMELRFCNSDVYFLNRHKNCVGGHLLLRFSVGVCLVYLYLAVVSLEVLSWPYTSS